MSSMRPVAEMLGTGDPRRCLATDLRADPPRFGCYARHICSLRIGHRSDHYCYCHTEWTSE